MIGDVIRECTDCMAEVRDESSGPFVHAVLMATEGIGGSSKHYNFTDEEMHALVLSNLMHGWQLEYIGFGYWDLRSGIDPAVKWRWLDRSWRP